MDEGRELRPKADQIEADDTGLMYKAAASGRTDVLGPAGLLGLQRAVGNAGVTSAMEEERSPVLNVVGSGGGAPLDTDTRADMESRLGHDFGDVRVHTDSNARRTRRGRSTRTPTPSARTSCSSATSTTPPRPRADRRRRALRRAHRARHSPRGLRRRTPSRAHPPTLHQAQSLGFDQTLAKASVKLCELADILARGKTRRTRAKLDTEIAQILRDPWVRRVITWELTGQNPPQHRLSFHTDERARADLEADIFGKSVLTTDRNDLAGRRGDRSLPLPIRGRVQLPTAQRPPPGLLQPDAPRDQPQGGFK